MEKGRRRFDGWISFLNAHSGLLYAWDFAPFYLLSFHEASEGTGKVHSVGT